MASYILYGKDEEGQNAVQRGDTLDNNKRYNSYKKKDDKALSLEEILDNPFIDQQQIKPMHQRDAYVRPRPSIKRPKYDKEGNIVDIGDGDIPGMWEVWDSIDRLSHWIAQLEGKIPPEEGVEIFDDSYRLYRLKHNLIDIRRTQYYLKDSYKPEIHFLAIDHPKTQYYDWCGDAFYWMPYDKWKERVNNALTSNISRDLKDYETRGEGDQLEVKWVVRHHTFDWENPSHVRALINQYDTLYESLKDKLDTYGRTLIWDFERYCELANLTPIRTFILKCKIDKMPYVEIIEELDRKFNLTYNINHLSTILTKEIPKKIAEVAKKQRLLIETPISQKKRCRECGKLLPMDAVFFGHNYANPDTWQHRCKICEKQLRISKGGQNVNDKRSKDT